VRVSTLSADVRLVVAVEEVAEEAALEAMRIHGGYGYSQEYPIERLYRDAPVLILGEGSNEIQQLLIARRLFERHDSRTR